MVLSLIMERREGGEKEEEGKTRIYVGGLGESVTSDDLTKIFASLGMVKAVEIVRSKGRSFGYVDFLPSSDKSLSKLFSTYNGCVWKGGRLRLEKAKAHYLVRLKREWEEDSQPEVSPPTESASSEIPIKVHNSEKKLNLFFPRLRKVKPLPLSGTGKHKYSFQRVEAPPLPTYFCDCEEHSVSYNPAEGKQLYNRAAVFKQADDLETRGGGINEEELNIMNSVMQKLFDKEKVSDEVLGSEEKDNMVINVVPKENKRENTSLLPKNQESVPHDKDTYVDGPAPSVLKLQRKSNLPPNKKRKSQLEEENTRNESMSADPGREITLQSRKRGEVEPGAKHSSWLQKSSWRALVGDKSNSVFSVSNILPDTAPMEERDNAFKLSIEDMQLGENEADEDEDDLVINVMPMKNSNKIQKPETVFSINEGMQLDENEADEDEDEVEDELVINMMPMKNSTQSQKPETVFSVYEDLQMDVNEADEDEDNLLINMMPKKNGTKIQKPETVSTLNEELSNYVGHTSEGIAKNLSIEKEKSSLPPKKKREALVSEERSRLTIEDENSLRTHKTESGTSYQAQPARPDSIDKSSSKDHSDSEKSAFEPLVGDQGDDALSISYNSPEVSASEQHLVSDNNNKQKIERKENLESKADEIETENIAVEVEPTEPNEAQKQSNMGSSWFQKSSWTQLVSDSSSSFSITQIAPNITFGKSGPTQANPAHSSDSKSISNSVKQDNSEASRCVSVALEDRKAGIVVEDSSGKNQLTVVSNNEPAVSTVENTSDFSQRETSSEGVKIIGETCSFMRSSASVKEWAKAKASLSGSKKKKSSKK